MMLDMLYPNREVCDGLEVDIDKQHGEDKTITNDVAPARDLQLSQKTPWKTPKATPGDQAYRAD